jgi:hypothetical protein
MAQAPTLTELLVEAQRHLQAGRIPEAIELLEQAKQATSHMEQEQLYLQEEFYWQRATAALDYAQRLTNEDQIRAMGSRARDLWQEYIAWYGGLTPGQHEDLPPNHDRIQKATRFLGNAGWRMRDLSQVLTDYETTQDVLYLGIDAITLWKNTVYRCPDWAPEGARTASLRRQKVCTDSCTDRWVAYAESLDEWARTFGMRQAARNRYLREASQVIDIAGACSETVTGGPP